MAADAAVQPGGPPLARLVKLAAVALAVAILYFARDVLQPLALAALLAFLLAPAVRRLEHRGAPRPLAVGVVACAAFAVLGLVVWLVVAQLVDLAAAIPRYRDNILARVEALQARPGPLEGAGDVLHDVEEELGEAGAVADATPRPAVAVAVAQGGSAIDRLRRALAPVAAPLGTAGVVVVFVLFFLLERHELRDRLFRLAGEGELLLATQALDEAARRVSRYLLAQLLVNVAYGVPVGIGLWAIGLPNAPLWGLLAVLLRYLPYVGPWIAALGPLALSLAVFPGWGQPLAVLALFLVLELIVNNLVEPYVYGAQTGLSPVALLLAALFWAWLWDVVGLVLAAPLTVCLVVLGRHVPYLSFVSVLFGDEPALSPALRLYQRLLAGDRHEAQMLVEEEVARSGGTATFDTVVLPALALEERDHHRGALAEPTRREVLAAVAELIAVAGPEADTAAADDGASSRAPRRQLLCLPAHDEADALAGRMLVAAAAERGVAEGRTVDCALAGELLAAVETAAPTVVCVSALPPTAALHARYLCKRLRARFPTLPVVVGLWQSAEPAAAERG